MFCFKTHIFLFLYLECYVVLTFFQARFTDRTGICHSSSTVELKKKFIISEIQDTDIHEIIMAQYQNY